MAKMRIHELAKEIDASSKDILQILQEKGLNVSTSANSISDEDVEFVKNKLGKTGNEEKKIIVSEVKSATENEKEPVKEQSESKDEKPTTKVIYTTKGVVRRRNGENIRRPDGERRRRPDGEHMRRPDGERRRRPDGEHMRRPDGERRRRPDGERMRRPDGERIRRVDGELPVKTESEIKVSPETEEKKTEEVTKVVKQQEEKVTETVLQEEKTTTSIQEEVKKETPEEKTEVKTEQEKTVQTEKEKPQTTKEPVKSSEHVDRPDRKREYTGNDRSRRQDGGNRQRQGEGYRRRNDGDRNGRTDGNRQNREYNGSQNRNYGDRQNKNDRFGGKTFDKDNRGKDNRGRSGYNKDGYSKDGFDRDNNRAGERRNDRRRNDFDRTSSMDVIQDKDRKAREDKIRQDKQERNRKNYNSNERGGKRQGKRGSSQDEHMLQKPEQKKQEKVEEIKVISIPEALTIGDLAEKMKMQPSVIIKKLFLEGKVVTINTDIDFETAEGIALEYEIMCEKEEKVDVIGELLKEEEEDESVMTKRPPVVCVMGHVDHGKTSLLDAIRKTNVISGEAGGITQHIGAYVVTINGEKITFLDTPGHEAFTSMRMRGAQSTDIAVLVVAADDGIMPQTVEAINHARAAEVEIIVAINKIDKPGANVDKVKKELAEYELLPEDWGGSTVCVPVSAHTGEGIDELLEMIILQAEVLELKANANRLARGIVIEAQLDKGRGPVATVLVQKGTLKVGDPIAAGSTHGKVRAMIDDKGNRIKKAGPSMPVEILGLNGVPNAGEVFVSTSTTNEAREFADTFIAEGREKMLEGTKTKLSLDDLYSQIQAGDIKELNIIIKADVQGSVEAVKQSLLKLSNDEVVVKVIHGGVGAINESDVILASASNAIIIGFSVSMDNQAKEISAREKVDVRLYDVIYNAIEDIEAAMKGMLDPVFEEQVIAHVEVRQTFKASGVGTIAGAYVLDGTIKRGCKVRIAREGKQIYEGELASLKRFKDDVKEVKSGFECGLVFDKFNDLAEGDMIEAYVMVEVAR